MAQSERSPQPPLIYPRREKELRQLLAVLGIENLPNPDWLLLDEALVHRSSSASRNYERLEFFGDAVLRLAASDYLLVQHPGWSVGDMTSVRNVLVSDRYLSKIARHYQLENYLVVGDAVQGELLKNGSLKNERLLQAQLADSVESLIGAIYQTTRSLKWVRPWLEPFWQDDAIAIYNDPTRQNHKAALQEWTQEHFKELPKYVVNDRAAAVEAIARFKAQVWFRETPLGTGIGQTRKAAEQAAAQEALVNLPAPEKFAPSPTIEEPQG
ncbi:MAG: ribonuclease III [Cyanobacteria bacterium P01_D01_bin.73]